MRRPSLVEAFYRHSETSRRFIDKSNVNTHDLAAVKGGIRLYTAAQKSHETSRINCKTEKNRRMKEIMGLDCGKSANKRKGLRGTVQDWKGDR